MTVLTAVVGANDDLIAAVAKLYLPRGARVADVTYGKGAFWKKTDLTGVTLAKSDLVTVPEAPWDCRKLPYGDASFDVAVLDPPYMHSSRGPAKVKASIADCYQTNVLTDWSGTHRGVIRLYREAMTEASRIVTKGGTVWVKCQDEIESGKQKRSHIEIWEIATRELGLMDTDLFVLVSQTRPAMRHTYQHHARKNNSFLWIFTKTS
jgi:hypothetical protein